MGSSEEYSQSSAKKRTNGGQKPQLYSLNKSEKVRLRRTQSVTQAEVVADDERKVRRFQSDKPFHKVRDSVFSLSSGFGRFEGFINWGALILVIGGTRLFLENIIKYGIRITPMDWPRILYESAQYNTTIFLVASNLHYLLTLLLEKAMAKNQLSNKVGIILHTVHLILIVLIPPICIKLIPDAFNLMGRVVICSVNTVMFLKLWSYIQVNYWCRIDREKEKYLRTRSYSFRNVHGKEISEEDANNNPCSSPVPSSPLGNYQPVQYPDNLTLSDLYYFLIVPTLCYELSFPRSNRIRVRFLLRRLIEVIILTNILTALFQQWIIPSLRNSFKPFSEMDYARCSERLLKLAIPNHLLWLIWFYLFFHSFLNTIGELTRFGDRNFYQDWWNSEDIATFWRLWNLPVHNWAKRHLYGPLVKARYSRFLASMAVFILSAIFHEYLVSIPLNMYKIGVFIGMILQLPLVHVSHKAAKNYGPRWGNIMVWASLILGQPLGIMVYYHDYVIENFNSIILQNF